MTPTELQRLKEICERVNREPIEHDGTTCSACYSTVKVHVGYDWEDGDICDSCAQEFCNEARTAMPALIQEVECRTYDLAQAHKELGEIEQENARLRKALEKIADPNMGGVQGMIIADMGFQHFAQHTAREALSGGGG